MRYLIGLSIVQAFALLFFGVRVMEVDARTDKIAALVQTSAAPTKLTAMGASNPYERDSTTIQGGPSLDDIRLVVREELSAINESRPASAQRTAPGQSVQTASTEAGALSPAESVFLKEETLRDIDSYVALGAISPAEMANLQIKIARLPPSDRREMLTRLTKAMNSGDLQGEF